MLFKQIFRLVQFWISFWHFYWTFKINNFKKYLILFFIKFLFFSIYYFLDSGKFHFDFSLISNFFAYLFSSETYSGYSYLYEDFYFKVDSIEMGYTLKLDPNPHTLLSENTNSGPSNVNADPGPSNVDTNPAPSNGNTIPDSYNEHDHPGADPSEASRIARQNRRDFKGTPEDLFNKEDLELEGDSALKTAVNNFKTNNYDPAARTAAEEVLEQRFNRVAQAEMGTPEYYQALYQWRQGSKIVNPITHQLDSTILAQNYTKNGYNVPDSDEDSDAPDSVFDVD